MNDLHGEHAQPRGTTAPCCVRISSGSRLHFGLLDTAEPFGGVGVMIDAPRTEVVVDRADRFAGHDPDGSRVLEIAHRVARHANLSQLPPCSVTITRRAPSHCGLGSGTQLAMSIAEALCRFVGLQPAAEVLAGSLAGRGKRSAVGVHGYLSGGLLFEHAERPADLNPLCERVQLPGEWKVGVFRPTQDVTTVSGNLEREQFSRLSRAESEATSELKQIIVQRMLPAARRGDFETFAQAVHEYNAGSGRLFQEVQGGPYNGAAVTRLIEWLIDRGVHGVGQSSWGPGVFAWFQSADQAEEIAGQLPSGIATVAIATPLDSPRLLLPTETT